MIPDVFLRACPAIDALSPRQNQPVIHNRQEEVR